MTAAPIILNFDDSVGALPQAKTVNLTSWQEKIRFAARRADFRALAAELARQLPPAGREAGTVFLGSGDYHHVSYLLIKRLGEALSAQSGAAAPRSGSLSFPAGQKLDVAVLDNHPDNMRYPFGIHCGSWISHLAALPFIGKIDVVGITSADIGLSHAVENRLAPLWRGKLCYWSAGVNTNWARLCGLSAAFRSFDSIEAMSAAFLAEQARRSAPLYFSLDKDVLARSVAQTNWDQGQMLKPGLLAIIKALRPRMIGADIVGEVSDYSYKSLFKRLMSRMDGQEAVSAAQLKDWQAAANRLNAALLPFLP